MLATAVSSRTIAARKQRKTRGNGHDQPVETYRVSAYNTAKHSENKMHDDTVAKRFGFSGGLVPGVDVMAYMMHLPVAKWGRAFLERGLIEARFVKPVYDGETGRRHRRGKQRRAVDRGREPRRALRHRHRHRCRLPRRRFRSPTTSRSPAVAERKPVDATSYAVDKWLGTVPRDWAGDAATEYLADIRETDPIYAREGLGHPGLLPAGDEQGAGR